MSAIDYIIIFAYLAGLIYLGISRRHKSDESAGSFILGGRMLTLPAFVATLVSSWYGGILGVGEYSYMYGVSTWLVFGIPYYIAALLFALFLAKRARQAEVLTIPDRLDAVYGQPTAVAGSVILFFMTLPAAYILMLSVLLQILFGWSLWVGAVLGTMFSVFYVFLGGFKAVVRTDLFQFGLMFAGFILLFVFLLINYGGFEFIRNNVPITHLTWHGGNSGWYIAVWYVIALSTLIEPAFYQRCYAAKSANVARNGIFVSILFWVVFDFLTTSCGLYARALLPELANPVASFPALAELVLPAGLLGLFALALLATVMSTIDSYSFLAASTFSRDIVWRMFKVAENRITYFTRIGLILSAGIALLAALFFESVVDIWHDFGSVGTPALLVPLFFAFNGKRKMQPSAALFSIILAGSVSFVWLLSGKLSVDGIYWLGLEPIFPGLLISVLFYLFGSKKTYSVID